MRGAAAQSVLASALFLGCSFSATAFSPFGASVTSRTATSPCMPLRASQLASLSSDRLPRHDRARLCSKSRPRSVLMAAGGSSGALQGAATHSTFLCAAAGKAEAIDAGLQVLISKVLGYGILVGSLFLQVPQLVKILKLKSVAGISRWSRYR